MKSHVAVYKTHKDAFKALKRLSERNFPMDHVSLIGKADIIDDHIHVHSIDYYAARPLVLFILGGILFGFLIGFEVFSIQQLHFLTGKSLFIHVFWGASMGLAIGSVFAILVALFLKNDKVIRFKEQLFTKRFLVVVNSTEEEIKMAQKILHTEGMFPAVA